jgi:hypothetical protein
MTCIVPTPLSRDHMHFIDGAAGGYAMAASRMKKHMSARLWPPSLRHPDDRGQALRMLAPSMPRRAKALRVSTISGAQRAIAA